jgi:bifunctional DNase/RNase
MSVHMAVEMRVKYLVFDPPSNRFVVLLSDLQDEHFLPIWVGPFEAIAIILKLKNIPIHRPMTHDLLRNIVEVFHSEIVKIEVNDLKENTYYATIHIRTNKKEIAVDARPSDAIAVALGAGVSISVTEEVLSNANSLRMDQLDDWLKSLRREDFNYEA